MYKMIASIYRYNRRGANKSIPYFATLPSIIVIYIFIYFLTTILPEVKNVFNYWNPVTKGEEYFIGAFFVIPQYSLAWSVFPERKITEQEALLTKKEYRLGLFAYVLLMVILMTLFFIVIQKRA